MYDKISRRKDEIFGFRTHQEHITVPMISAIHQNFADKGLHFHEYISKHS